MKKEYQIASPQELVPIAQYLLKEGYTTFLLQGELGVGKTQFVKSLVEQLGGNYNEVQSPTYTYMNEYVTPQGTVVHMDLYRIEDKEDAFFKGIFEEIHNHDYICIERPKREEEYINTTSIRLEFSFLADTERKIIVSSLR